MNTANKTEREKIAARIKALLAKTQDKGCSEGEAIAAAMKAKELSDKYQIDMSAAEFEAEGVVQASADAHIRGFDIQPLMSVSIGEFTDCKVWHQTVNVAEDGEPEQTEVRRQFLGLESDTEFACWLMVHLEDFVWAKADDFGLTLRDNEDADRIYTPKGIRLEKKTFAAACATRIAERLREEARKRNEKPVAMSDGRSLVVVKNALVKEAFKSLGIHLGRGRSRRFSYGSVNSAEAGRNAGNSATFGRPVNGNNRTALLR